MASPTETVNPGFVPASGWTLREAISEGHRLSHVGLGPDERHLSAVLNYHDLRVWNLNTHRADSFRFDGQVTAVAWDPTGEFLAVAYERAPASTVRRSVDIATAIASYGESSDDWLPSATMRTSTKWLRHHVLLFGANQVATALARPSPDGNHIRKTGSRRHLTDWPTRRHDMPAPRADLGYGVIDESVSGLAWSSDGRRLAVVGVEGFYLLDIRRTVLIAGMNESGGEVQACAFSPVGRQLVSAHRSGVAGLWDASTGRSIGMAEDNASGYLSCAWLTGSLVALGGYDGTVEIWSTNSWVGSTRDLEGHTSPVGGLALSGDGHVLVSHAIDGTIHLWDTEHWTRLAEYKSTTSAAHATQTDGAAVFARRTNTLVTATQTDLYIWDVAINDLREALHQTSTTHYCNAKIVLLGDSGVGKTGLGQVLAGEPFTPTESTHQRNIWRLSVDGEPDTQGSAAREAFLWDLAGQPGYRLLHQLQLRDVVIAVIVCDAHSDTDPFAGVRHWVRAMRQAQRLLETDTPIARLFLVAGRIDRGGLKLSKERVEAFLRQYGFDGYAETSAKAGWGVDELRTAILEAIDWPALPTISSTELFASIKAFVIEERDRAGVLATSDELVRSYERAQPTTAASADLREEFFACIGRVASRGLIKRLSFGNLVLLQPEVLDSYAAALANAARDEPDGLGSIAEDAARSGQFRMADSDRLKDRDVERLLLIAAIEDLLEHEVALREHSAEGSYLVFPSQARLELPDREVPRHCWASIVFDGSVQHIYATLVVRLSHSGFFRRVKLWRNAAVFAAAGGTVGILVTEPEEGRGEVTLFTDEDLLPTVAGAFEDYVVLHLQRRAISGSVVISRLVTCESCGCELTQQQVVAAIERGKVATGCPVCEERVTLTREAPDDPAGQSASVRAMDYAADGGRRDATAISTLQGKVEVEDFDVFLAHNSRDKPDVAILADELRRRGLNPWLDVEQIPPGRWFQDVIQAAVPKVRTAAVIFGRAGVGQWELVELRTFLAECVERTLPLIPVLLPGGRLPDDLPMLRQLRYVTFQNDVREPSPLSELAWGITGARTARIARV